MDREKSLHHLLPQHIIVEEILPRLPVKSLSRFRCVSKSWASLIDSKRFIKTHLQNSSRNHRLILNCRGRIRIKQSSSLQSRLDGSIDPTPIDDPNINRLKVLSLVGCFNGLVCILYNSRSFMFWNPSTRNFKELPQAHDEAGCDLFILNHGFGWDESSDDYKVFASVHIVHMHMHISEKVMGKVYSWKTDSWKTVEHMDLPPVYKEGMFVGGKLHWRRYKGERNIVCFDLNTEVWGKIELPYNCNEEESGVHGMVGVIGGYLSSVKEYKRTTAEVWVMKEYGWSKLIALSQVQELVQRPLQGQAIYAAVGGDGDILLFFGRFFLVYNPQHNEFRTRGQLFDNSFYQETICVESLV